jgi:hypothetical protein
MTEGTGEEIFGGNLMRRIVLLLAAALAVSAPLGATVSTDSYAASAKAKKAAKDAKQSESKWSLSQALADLYDGLTKPFTSNSGKGDKGGKGTKKTKKG